VNQPRSKRRPTRRPTTRRPKTSVDPWRVPPPLPDAEPIPPRGDVTALLRSLGDPPIAGSGHLASYFAAAAERAAAVATALALSAELPASPPDTSADPST
jgi:hypothetical protein